jgi:formylglycine-generating enzyme required for sulfatase activity
MVNETHGYAEARVGDGTQERQSLEQYREEARNIPFASLSGLHVFTVGKTYIGLSQNRFRQLLRVAGAVIDPLVDESTDLVVIGEEPSRYVLLRALKAKGARPRPCFAKAGAVAARFWDDLRQVKVARDQTFGEYLAAVLSEEAKPDLAETEAAAGGAGRSAVAMEVYGGTLIEFVWIEAGDFVMGETRTGGERADIDGPPHRVTITRGFYLGKYPITQQVWQEVMGTAPWEGERHVRAQPNCPAVCISWNDAQAFISRLNETAGGPLYRLPTEAEWEYACRAGTTTSWSMGDDENLLEDYAWYRANAWEVGERYAHAVGRKRPNSWGLYDMHGNVYEWVQDWYGRYSPLDQIDPAGPPKGTARVRRGGSFYFDAQSLRSAFRSHWRPDRGNSRTGARLVRVAAHPDSEPPSDAA